MSKIKFIAVAFFVITYFLLLMYYFTGKTTKERIMVRLGGEVHEEV